MELNLRVIDDSMIHKCSRCKKEFEVIKKLKISRYIKRNRLMNVLGAECSHCLAINHIGDEVE